MIIIIIIIIIFSFLRVCTIGLWQFLTCQSSHADISPLILMTYLIDIRARFQKMFHFLSVSWVLTLCNKCFNNYVNIIITLRKSHKIIMWGIFEKSQILTRDVFDICQRRHGKDIFFKICLRCLKDITFEMFLRGLWDVSLNGDLTEIPQRHLMSAGCG